MTRERFRQAATIAVLLVAGALVLGYRAGWRRSAAPAPAAAPAAARAPSAPAEPTPQNAVFGMLDAARWGDVDAYLGCYTGSMRTSLDASVAESGADGFARHLRDSQSAIKGVAVSEPDKTSPTECRVQVQYVYQDRNETQSLYLEKIGPEWKIARVDAAGRAKTLAPYRAPVK